MAGTVNFPDGLTLSDDELNIVRAFDAAAVSDSSDSVPSSAAVQDYVAGELSAVMRGPVSSTDGAVALFDGIAGNKLKDSGMVPGAANGLATLGSDGLLTLAQVRGSAVALIAAPTATQTGSAGSIGYYNQYVYFWYADNKVVSWAARSSW